MATTKKKKVEKTGTVKVQTPNLLHSWQDLNKYIKTLDEKECGDLLTKEKAGKQRMGFLLRIYGRYNTLRTIRERAELAGGAQQ